MSSASHFVPKNIFFCITIIDNYEKIYLNDNETCALVIVYMAILVVEFSKEGYKIKKVFD